MPSSIRSLGTSEAGNGRSSPGSMSRDRPLPTRPDGPRLHVPGTPEFLAAVNAWQKAQAAHQDACAALHLERVELSPKLEALIHRVTLTGTLVDVALEAVVRAS